MAPDTNQNKMYETMIPPLLSRFVDFKKGQNVLFFAYGQTGTGKTHTIFGPKDALQHPSRAPEWGIISRVVSDVLNYMTTHSDELKTSLTAGAIEFYLLECMDLLNDRASVEIDPEDRVPLGYTEMPILSIDDLVRYLEKVDRMRTATGTRMNEQSSHHGGSSRSHCSLILTLRQLDPFTQSYVRTKFSIIDLAGSERPHSVGKERKSGTDVMLSIMQGCASTMDVSTSGFLINYELHELAREAIKATEAHKCKRKFVPMKQLCSPAIQYLSSAFDGSSLLGMVICLSQALQCGMETWFSCQYGTTLSKLRCPVRFEKVSNFVDKEKQAQEAATKAQRELDKSLSTGPGAKYYNIRQARATHTRYQLRWLQQLGSS